MLDFLLIVLSFTIALDAHPGTTLDHRSPHSLSGAWYHEKRHPVHDLFRRAVGADGQNYPDVGSDAWRAKYPNAFDNPDPSKMPQEWAAALKKAEDSGKIPNLPLSTEGGVYPGANPAGPEICSAYIKCINKGDIWDAPDGVFAHNFDDGPVQSSLKLLDFLKSKNEHTTHFLIGRTILTNVEPFKRVIASGDDIAVHTWTHRQMTTLHNADIVAELGWTMQIIHDSTGGRVPRYWRPPTGDSDNRVRAIAAEVFGLRTVIWNRDTRDWDIPKTTHQSIDSNYTSWAKGPKSPGLIVLEHELNDETVQIFIDHYPEVKANGWRTASLLSVVDGGNGAYRNVVNGQVKVANLVNDGSAPSGNANNTATASPSGSVPPVGSSPPPSSPVSSPASSATSSAPSPSKSNGAMGWRRDGFAVAFLSCVLAALNLA